MDVREKLIEILKTKYDHFCDQCGINKDSKYIENLASHLIANGVTVQKKVEISDELLKQLKNAPITICKEEPSIELVQEWISVKDRLPEDQEEVLVCTCSKKGIRNIDKGYMAIDHFIHRGAAEVTHWMPLPKLPKEIDEPVEDDKR